MRPIRVLTLIDTIQDVGGAELLAVRTTIALDPSRFERWVCVTRHSGGVLEEELRAAGVRIVRLERTRRGAVTAWVPLVRLLRRERIDVLHAHKFGSNLWGTIVGRSARVPVVVAHEHSWADEADGLRRLLDRHVIGRGADAFLAVAREDARKMIEIEKIPRDRVRLFPNAIAAPPPPDREAARAALGLLGDAVVVGSVGRLEPVKRYDLLVEAAALLAPHISRLRVVVVGAGSEEENLRALVATRGLEEHVLLTGPRNDVPALLPAFDIAVNCSDTEGAPLSVLEYMAAGLPIVATRVGGLPELVRDDETGVLVPPGDASALAAALDRLATDETLRTRLGSAAQDVQRQEHDLTAAAERLGALYEELLDRRLGHRRRG